MPRKRIPIVPGKKAKSSGFVLDGLTEEQVVNVGGAEDVGLLEELYRRLLCLLRQCHPRDVMRLQRATTREERRRWNVGTISYGEVCGRCDRLLQGMRTEPKPGTV